MQSAYARAERVGPRPYLVGSRQDDPIESIRFALAQLQQGRPVEALDRLDRLHPPEINNAPACGLAGLICISAGSPRSALGWLDRALALEPAETALLAHRANVLSELGQHERAIAAFEAAHASGPTDPTLHYNHGNQLRAVGRLGEAIVAYDAALQLRAQFPDALRAAASVLCDLGQTESALRCFGEVLRQKPDDHEAWLQRTALLHRLGRHEETLTDCERALSHCPGSARLLMQRGAALQALGRHGEARDALESALKADPDLAEAHRRRGAALLELDRPDEAVTSFERAKALDSNTATACGLGAALRRLGRLGDALACAEEALEADPDCAAARALRGEVRLLQGDLDGGLADYEARFEADPATRPSLPGVPLWTAGRCEGAKLAVLVDGSEGDAIRCARFLPLLADMGADVTVVCPLRLQGLLSAVAPALRVVDAAGPDDRFDLQVALTSLPACLRVTRQAIPATSGYLKPETTRVAAWRERIGRAGLKIGLCWDGRHDGQPDRGRSVPLDMFAELAALPDVRLIALDPPHAEATGPEGFKLERPGHAFGTGPEALADAAAVIAGLDLVVTCDAALAHLAGAVGRPVWVLLPETADWVWMTDTDVSPWYAGMRLFRQTERGAWSEPVEVLTLAVAQWAEAWRAHRDAVRAASRTLHVPLPVGDVVDRLTILRLKRDRLGDDAEAQIVRRQLDVINQAIRDAIPAPGPGFLRLVEELAQVNQALWTIRDQVRTCERQRDFTRGFIALARSAHLTNDRRTALIRAITQAAAQPEA